MTKFALPLLFGGLLIASGATTAAAKEAPGSNARLDALRSCRAIADAAARTACYDRATDDLLAASERRQIVILDKSEVRSARRGLFGFALPRIPFLDNASTKEEAAEISRLTTKISSVRRTEYGKFRFRLDDGALWETVESSSDLTEMRSGETITLVRGMFGAYFLEKGRTRVQARRLPGQASRGG